MPPPKTSNHATFHRDRSNQLGESVKNHYVFGPSRRFFCHGQKRDYLSRVSQRARGATKNDTDVAHYNFNPHQLTLVILAEMLLRQYTIKR